jgi:hypothetical protein
VCGVLTRSHVDKFYKGISTQDLEHNTRTGYQWGFTNRIDEKEALTLSSSTSSVSLLSCFSIIYYLFIILIMCFIICNSYLFSVICSAAHASGGAVRDEISRETNRPKGARPPPRRPASTTMAAPSPSTRGPSGPAVKHPDDEGALFLEIDIQ